LSPHYYCGAYARTSTAFPKVFILPSPQTVNPTTLIEQ
jgi:hypothetical protein